MGRGPMAAVKTTKAIVTSPGYPTMPEFLTGEAAKEWKRICPELKKAGLLTKCDRAVVASYCQAWEELVETTNQIKKDGRFLKVKKTSSKGDVIGEGVEKHPALQSQRDAMMKVKSFLDSLGLTPAARIKMQTVQLEGPHGGGDEFQRLANRSEA